MLSGLNRGFFSQGICHWCTTSKLKSSLAFPSSLILSLRSFDEERTAFAAAVANGNGERRDERRGDGANLRPQFAGSSDSSFGTRFSTHPNSGFVSPMAKIYLTDVLDHVDSTLNSLDLFMALTGQLENYIFNLLSFSSNETMKKLTYITIIFLPLSFIAGEQDSQVLPFSPGASPECRSRSSWRSDVPCTRDDEERRQTDCICRIGVIGSF